MMNKPITSHLIHRVQRMALLLLSALMLNAAGAAESVIYYHNDALGSPIAATDEAGQLVWQESYMPYGDRIKKEDSGTNDLWYTGKPHEESFGLSYFGARWYDPLTGRFMAIDPVGFRDENPQSFNRYAYANNNPYRYIDPDGRESVESVKYRMSTGKMLAHPGGGNGASFPRLMTPVPGFSQPMMGNELAANILGMVGVAGEIRTLLSYGAGKISSRNSAPIINWNKQAKHFPGHNHYTPGRSILTSNPETLATKAGSGQQVGKLSVGSPGSKERIDFNEVIGTYIDRVGNSTPTTRGLIHYGKDGIHIVPGRPK